MKKLKLKVKSWVEVEQNPFYKLSLSCNGGGYHQPLTTIKGVVNNQSFKLVIDNQSCGDFGKDIIITLTINSKIVCGYYYENMRCQDECLSYQNEYFVRLMIELLKKFGFEKYARWVNDYTLPF